MLSDAALQLGLGTADPQSVCEVLGFELEWRLEVALAAEKRISQQLERQLERSHAPAPASDLSRYGSAKSARRALLAAASPEPPPLLRSPEQTHAELARGRSTVLSPSRRKQPEPRHAAAEGRVAELRTPPRSRRTADNALPSPLASVATIGSTFGSPGSVWGQSPSRSRRGGNLTQLGEEIDVWVRSRRHYRNQLSSSMYF